MDNNIIHTDWSHLKQEKDLNLDEIKVEINLEENKHKPFFFYFFIFGVSILLISIIFTAYKYYFNKSSVSTEKINLSLTMPDDVKAGERDQFKIEIGNGNKVILKDVRLKFSYQKGFTREGETDMLSKDFFFGDVSPSNYIATTSDYIFIGSEGDIRNVKLLLSYKVENSNAEFSKTLEKDVKINSPLASVKIDGPKNVIEDYESVYFFKVKNLSLKNFIRSMLVVEMPNGFAVKKVEGQNPTRFLIENLPLGEEAEFKVVGYFKDSVGQTKNIRSYVAEIKENDELGSSYTNDVYEVNINNSVISYKTKVEVLGEKLDFFVKYRDSILRENILDLEIENMSQDALSEINVILTNKNTKEEYKWDMKTDEGLLKINPGSVVNVKKTINDFASGQNSYFLEIYGKRRGEFNSVLLKKAEFSIEGR